MWEIFEGIRRAFELILSGDPIVLDITARSIFISGGATLLAALWGLPIGVLLGLKGFKGRRILKGTFNALLGVPTVALGLILYLLFSRSGLLGPLELLYSPTAIMLGQAILVTPIVVSLTVSAVEAVDPDIRELAKTLGASGVEESLAVIRESAAGVILAVIASFNRAIAELGVALMVGGNIRGLTRVLTTSIALETIRGEIALGIALAIILLVIVYSLSLTVNLVVKR